VKALLRQKKKKKKKLWELLLETDKVFSSDSNKEINSDRGHDKESAESIGKGYENGDKGFCIGCERGQC
jgi:hypothetical protein